MEPELGLDQTEDLAHFAFENGLIEFLDHLPRAEFTQAASMLARGAGGMFPCNCRKVGAGFNLFLEVFADLLACHQNVAGSGSCHGVLLVV